MAYAYWKSGKVDDVAVFDLFFRKNPFHGEFTIFAGLEECIKFLYNFRYSDSDLVYLRQILPPYVEEEFFQYLKDGVSVSDVTLYAIPEGSVVFPRYVKDLLPCNSHQHGLTLIISFSEYPYFGLKALSLLSSCWKQLYLI